MRRDVFQAIADPTRRAIISLVSGEDMTSHAIAAHFKSTRQAVAKHVKILSECQLLKQENKGREVYYKYNYRKLKELDEWLEPFRKNWDKRFDQLDIILKTSKTKKS